MLVALIWPFGSEPPPQDEAADYYLESATYADKKGFSKFCLNYLHCESQVVTELGLDAFKPIHYYPHIEEDGCFPDGPDDWVTPQVMRSAVQKVLDWINGSQPEGKLLRDAYVKCQFGPEDGGPSPEEHIENFREELISLIQDCMKCEEQGIERVTLCAFD